MALNDNLAEIVRLDREIEAIRSQKVLTLAEITEIRKLKDQRGWNVAAIQNYKAPSTGLH